MRSFSKVYIALTACGFGALSLSPVFAGEPSGAVKPMGMASITLRVANYVGKTDCPNIESRQDVVWLEKYATPEQREKYSKPENDIELQMLAHNAPGRSDNGTSPAAYLAYFPKHSPVPAPQGNISYGVNLDGTQDGHATAKTCAHPKYQTPKGARAVDNQLYRALGCARLYRVEKRMGEPKLNDPFDFDVSSFGNKEMANGEEMTLIEILSDHGIQDGAVEVGIYSGTSNTIMGGNGKPIPWTSQMVEPDSKYQYRVKGKIANGHLTTEPVDNMVLKRHSIARRGLWAIRDARLDLDLRPDGSAIGLLAGYFPINDLYWFHTAGYLRSITNGKFDFAAQYLAMYKQADGYPDPETGQCTALSGALAIETVPAFIIHPQSENKVSENKVGSAPTAR